MKIIVTGKLKDDYFKKIEAELIKSIKNKVDFEIIELNDEKIPTNASEKEELLVLKKEGEKILEKLTAKDYVVSLCIEGKEIDTNHFKNTIANNKREIVFIIGGSLGLSDEVKKRSNLKISFSKMTFTHQMMRIILVNEIDKAI